MKKREMTKGIAKVSMFLFVPFWLLFSYISIFYYFNILKRKAKKENEINCIKRLWSPRKNPLLTSEERKILNGIDSDAFRKFQAARFIAVGIALLFVSVMILNAFL